MIPFDPGLQLERSELAWRRTSLSFGLTSLVALRILPTVFDDVRWVAAGAAGVLLSALLWAATRRRCLRILKALRAHGLRARLSGGALTLVVSVEMCIAGAGGIAIVVAAAAIDR